MPTNVVSIHKMGVGEKGGGKHWTQAEVDARRRAAERLQRQNRPKLKCPAWLKNDRPAYAIWSKLLKDAKAFDLLDLLDANTLATYCKLEAEKTQIIMTMIDMDATPLEKRKDGHATVRVALTEDLERISKTSLAHAEKLGLTPNSRARLAKRLAETEEDPNEHLFE
jgi:P27 family predicted phage terminase small subunit